LAGAYDTNPNAGRLQLVYQTSGQEVVDEDTEIQREPR
jgi:hypothetical protein